MFSAGRGNDLASLLLVGDSARQQRRSGDLAGARSAFGLAERREAGSAAGGFAASGAW